MAAIKVKPGIPRHLDVNDNPSFDEWFKRVDRFVSRNFGVGLDDLPDCDYLSWYDDRLRPIHAANKALKNAGAEI